jgi:hypothetical protein
MNQGREGQAPSGPIAVSFAQRKLGKSKVKRENPQGSTVNVKKSVSVDRGQHETYGSSAFTDLLIVRTLRTHIHLEAPSMTIARSQLIDPAVTRW